MRVPNSTVWPRLDDDSKTRLLQDAVRDVARRSFAGALIYFLTLVELPFGSSCLRDHPRLTILALACTLIAGLTRWIAARQVLRQPVPSAGWARTLYVSTLATVGPWGAFCAVILYYYSDTWPSTYLLIAGAALAGGAVASLAPNLLLGVFALLLTVLPSGICALLIGNVRSEVLGLSACAYLVYLMIQLRHNWRAYWKVATAPALEAMLSREAATRSEFRFQTLFEDAPSGIYLAFQDGQVEMANRALALMLGYATPDKIAGRNLKEFSLDSDRAEIRAPIQERGVLAGWESNWRRRDGTEIRVRESIRAVQTGSHAQDRLLGIVEDVTALFAADQERRQLIEILEGTSDFVERIAVTGETLYMNRACRSLLGEDHEGVESVWNRGGDEALRQRRLRIAAREGIWQGESWLSGADGRPVPVSQVILSHRLAADRLGNSAVHAYSIISRDITPMREANKALRETEEQLFHAQRLESLGRLAGGIAHDFNNLLTIIMGHASILALKVAEPRARAGIAEVEKAAARAADLTKQLLAFGRKQVLSKGIVDIKEIVDGAERMLRSLIGEQIDLILRLSEEPQTVMADAAQLEQVLINLILNARDAMPQGGVATIETSTVRDDSPPAGQAQPRDYVRISVSDTGVGMDEETVAHIFEPFFTTKGPGRGTGLGLATAYGFIRQSGGRISVSSQPGIGTAFVILLPRTTTGLTPARPEAPLADPGGSERILVVDDEPALRSLLRDTLATHGYQVKAAGSGEEALALASSVEDGARPPFDLLVTDVIMPGMTGPKLAARMKAQFPGMAVLFVSGYPGETVADCAGFTPAAGYLAKPFTAEVLLRNVRQQLESGRPTTAQ
jgi:PAS domain S-box-containing protein